MGEHGMVKLLTAILQPNLMSMSINPAGRAVVLICFAVLFSTCGSSQSPNSGTMPDLDKVKASKILKVGFKEWLKGEGYSMDITRPNPHETFQPGNHYSNHFYNLVIDFPDTWEADRGVGPYTLFRAFQGDSALSIALQVTTANITGQESTKMSAAEKTQMETKPLAFFNDKLTEGYSSYMQRQIQIVSGVTPIDFEVEEKRMGSMVYLVTKYRSKEWLEDVEYYVMNEGWVANRWANAYTISYSAPDFLYDPNLVSGVAHQAQFLNPNFFNGKD